MDQELADIQSKRMTADWNHPKTLIIGIGNCGRTDDGLGWAFLDFLSDTQSFRGKLEYRYQLQIEDAHLIQHASRVLFVDATRSNLPGGFKVIECHPSRQFEFTTHALKPEAILFLTNTIYGKNPEAIILGIQGEKWDLHNGLSEIGKQNLTKAIDWFAGRLVFS